MNRGARATTSLLFLITLLSFSACDRDEDMSVVLVDERSFPGVDERLWPFFIRFEDRAAERGVVIDLKSDGITGVIQEIEADNIADHVILVAGRQIM